MERKPAVQGANRVRVPAAVALAAGLAVPKPTTGFSRKPRGV